MVRIFAFLALLATTAWLATNPSWETVAAFIAALTSLVAADNEFLKRARVETETLQSSREKRVLVDEIATVKAELEANSKDEKLSEQEEGILAFLWNGSYSAAELGRLTTMSEGEAIYHLGMLEKRHLVHIPIVINGRGTANITQEGREYLHNRNIPKSVDVVFPDGETQGGVDLLIITLVRQNGEETERNLPGALGHNLSTTNRYITFAERQTLVRRDQVQMQPGVKITPFGIRYADSKNLK
jgi:hypothetical protein